MENRSRIQILIKRLDECCGTRRLTRPSRDDERRWCNAWAVLVGASFSLWRAVFLAEAMNERRRRPDVHKHAVEFLDVLIRSNAMAFQQEQQTRMWTSRYYLTSAIYRVREAIDEVTGIKGEEGIAEKEEVRKFKAWADRPGPERFYGFRTRELWSMTFGAAEKLVERLEGRFRQTRG